MKILQNIIELKFLSTEKGSCQMNIAETIH